MAALAYRYAEPVRDEVLTVAALRDFMNGRWALLFSHADDFASYGFEADRWLVHVERSFSTAGVVPLALTAGAREPDSWVDRIGGAPVIIRFSDAHRTGGSMCTRERSLVSTVLGQTTRFVLILDESLRPRITYAYSPGDRLPSPIDLVSIAHRARERLAK